MKIGLQMYTLRNVITTKEDYITALERLHEIGYRNLQVRKNAFMDSKEHKALLDKYEMKADSVFLPIEEIREGIADAVEEAKIFGVDVIRTDSIPNEYRVRGEQGYRDFAREIDSLGELCRKNGLKLIYHFHSFEWINFGTTRGIDILLNETKPENLYFMPDVFWLTNAGTEPSVSLRMFDGRAFYIHVKDYAIRQLKGAIENVPFFYAPVGTGNLNWNGIKKTAEEIGITHFIVEQDDCEGDVFEAVKISFDNLVKLGIEP